MSPDGKWIWDGSQWRPIPVHEAAFPNWKGVGAGFVPEVDGQAQAVAAVPDRSRRGAPLPSYRLAGPAPTIAAPRWSRDSAGAGIQKYARLAVVAAGLVVVIVLVSVVATLALSNRPGPAPTTTVIAPKAGGPTARSESGQATYIAKSLEAPMADLKDALNSALTNCSVGMSSACEDAVIATSSKVEPLVGVLDSATIPLCVAAAETIVRVDLGKVVAGEQLSLKGFQESNRTEWKIGYNQFTYYGVHVITEFAAIKSAAGSCDTALTGP